ncbi:MAG TPA: 50S ribosomal protein L11 methyltransferase, partial [Gemmataceae bacterium]|nr:50S ribosomal protein L11 methyltransferase [Gemmataceae bacterium]
IVVTAAKVYGCRAVGVDLDPERVKESKENAEKNHVEKLVVIERKDIFKVDLSEATVVALYTLPEVNVQLIPQFQQLKPGSRIVSHDFGIKGMKPRETFTMRVQNSIGLYTPHKIYLWVTPLEKE